MAGVSVDSLYQNMLGRSPESQDVSSYWGNMFGNSVDQTEAQTWWQEGNKELSGRADNWSGGTVSDLYTDLLGRQGSQSEQDWWSGQFGDTVDTSEAQQFYQAAQPEYTKRLENLYNPNYTTTAVPSGTVDFSNIGNNVANPAATAQFIDAAAPKYDDTYTKMYQNTFTNPQAYWNEYSQGQGAAVTEASARAMAASGRTGLMPTLQNQAYQDYMSNYLPSVREGLASGLNYESALNSTLGTQYGNELDYNKSVLGNQVSAYNTQMGLEQAKVSAMSSASDQNTRKAIAELESMAQMYGADQQLMQQIYSSMATMFPSMTKADQEAFVLELGNAFGMANTSATASANATTTPTTTSNASLNNLYSGT